MAIVGSAPSCLDNEPGFIDGHDIVVRINNFKLFPETGYRTDVFYSFFGGSIRKDAEELRGVRLCMCKCPDAKIIDSPWHNCRKREKGVDFRYIYRARRNWWPCDVYVPETYEFMEIFQELGQRIPTTGFACIYTLAKIDCEIYITGFDFFSSGIHNVDEPWRPGRKEDPIRHAPERELAWLTENRDRFNLDKKLKCLTTKEPYTQTTSNTGMRANTSSP